MKYTINFKNISLILIFFISLVLMSSDQNMESTQRELNVLNFLDDNINNQDIDIPDGHGNTIKQGTLIEILEKNNWLKKAIDNDFSSENQEIGCNYLKTIIRKMFEIDFSMQQ